MSILINGMKMPKERECVVIFSDGKAGKYPAAALYGYDGKDARYAIELPPHGRLIDADKVCKSVQAQTEIMRKWGIDEMTEIADLLEKGFLQEVENAETIIPAEGGENNCGTQTPRNDGRSES